MPGGVAEDWVVEWGAPQESVSRVRALGCEEIVAFGWVTLRGTCGCDALARQFPAPAADFFVQDRLVQDELGVLYLHQQVAFSV